MPPHLSQVPFPVQFRASNRCLFGVRGPPARLRSSDERPPMPVHSGQLNRNALRQGCPHMNHKSLLGFNFHSDRL